MAASRVRVLYTKGVYDMRLEAYISMWFWKFSKSEVVLFKEHTQVITITQMVRLLFCCLNKQQDVTTTTLTSEVLLMLLCNND